MFKQYTTHMKRIEWKYKTKKRRRSISTNPSIYLIMTENLSSRATRFCLLLSSLAVLTPKWYSILMLTKNCEIFYEFSCGIDLRWHFCEEWRLWRRWCCYCVADAVVAVVIFSSLYPFNLTYLFGWYKSTQCIDFQSLRYKIHI